VKHDFLDKHARLDSPLHRRDPRAKAIAILGTILVVVSEPRGALLPFLPYVAGFLVLALASRIPAGFFSRRLLLALPFVLSAAALYPLSVLTAGDLAPLGGTEEALRIAASIALRALIAVLYLTLLGSTTRFHDLLWGLRKLGMPPTLGVLCALMYRYAFILSDEMLRTSLARASRTPDAPRSGRIAAAGSQAAMVFLRGWERAQRVHGAMMARGFTGEFPVIARHRFGLEDGLFTASVLICALAVRLAL
jgi:cobalt/nickel transport system permease protein